MIKRQQAADASAETLAGVAGTRHNLVRNCNTRDSTAACVEAVVTQKYSAQSRPSVLFFFYFLRLLDFSIKQFEGSGKLPSAIPERP